MAASDDEPIWYASYGSNCSATRFRAYLAGSHAPGAAHGERGARDTRGPAESAAFWFPAGVRFIGSSTKWGGGGVAFLDHGHGGRSAGRRYLITRGQFEDVAAQESGRDRVSIPCDELIVGRVHPIGSGWYDGLLALPPIDGVPVLTFTSPHPLTDRPTASPSAAYLRTILIGLLEVHELPVPALVELVLTAPGVSDGWTADEIHRLLDTGSGP